MAGLRTVSSLKAAYFSAVRAATDPDFTSDACLEVLKDMRYMLDMSLTAPYRSSNCQAVFCSRLLESSGMDLLQV